MDAEMERKARKLGLPEGDIKELRKFSEFLAKRKAFRKARDEGTLTEEMKREYRELIDNLDK
jgi:hypothetical protein